MTLALNELEDDVDGMDSSESEYILNWRANRFFDELLGVRTFRGLFLGVFLGLFLGVLLLGLFFLGLFFLLSSSNRLYYNIITKYKKIITFLKDIPGIHQNLFGSGAHSTA